MQALRRLVPDLAQGAPMPLRNLSKKLPSLGWLAAHDAPEVLLLYGAIAGALGMGAYTIHRTLLSNEAGSFVNIRMRGDPFLQLDRGNRNLLDGVGLADSGGGHSVWWRAAQMYKDDWGARCGVFDNRTHAFQYAKPGQVAPQPAAP